MSFSWEDFTYDGREEEREKFSVSVLGLQSSFHFPRKTLLEEKESNFYLPFCNYYIQMHHNTNSFTSN